MRKFLLRNIVPVLCAALLFGAAMYSLYVTPPMMPQLDAAIGSRSTVTGVVVKDPDLREKTLQVTLRVESVNGKPIDTQTRILLFADRFSGVAFGDRIIASGVMRVPEPFETDSGRTFNYPKYLLAHGVTHTMSFPTIAIEERGRGNPVIASLIAVKHTLIRGIERALPEPESALLAGLLLGEKQSLGEKITDAFRNAGVVHIIVLSGYNVALIIDWVSLLLLYALPRGWAYAATALFVVSFAIMTGASETTIRATIMGLLMMVATVLRRPKAALRGLLIAAAAMALYSPYIVLYDLSFQLSVLATLGLILFSDKLAERMKFIPETFKFREIVATTLATQAVVLPLLIFSIGTVSLVFLPANILILPAVPVAMFVGFITSLVALGSSTVAMPLVALSYGVLRYIIEIAVWFGSLPFSVIPIPFGIMGEVLLVIFAVYGLGLLWWLYKKKALI